MTYNSDVITYYNTYTSHHVIYFEIHRRTTRTVDFQHQGGATIYHRTTKYFCTHFVLRHMLKIGGVKTFHTIVHQHIIHLSQYNDLPS